MKIKYKILAGYGAVLFLLSVCMVVVFVPILTKLNPLTRELKQNVHELHEATTLLDLNSDIRLLRLKLVKETAQFALGQDKVSQHRYVVAQRKMHNALNEALRQSGGPEDRDTFKRLTKLNQASERLEESVFELVRNGKEVEARAVAVGEEYMGVTEDFSDVLVQFEYRKKMTSADEFSVLVGITEFIVTSDRALRVAIRRSVWLALTAAIISIALAMFTITIAMRFMTQRVAEVTAQAVEQD